jgi:AraC-like DNA-binding protein
MHESVPDSFDSPRDQAEFHRLTGRAGVELYRAHIVRHAFAPHTHEAFGFGAIERGVERFRYGGSEHLAPPDSIVFMNPDTLHTGRAETEDGWRYRMIYIAPEVLTELSGDAAWWFIGAVADGDRARAQRLSCLLDALWRADEPLAIDSLLSQVVATLRPLARVDAPMRKEKPARFDRVIDYMRAHLDRSLRLEELAAIAELSPFHFLRSFRAQFHVTPQQMLMAHRLYAAKCLLAAGEPPARVAPATGLCDQAHLTRAFSCRYGVTPARYQRQLRV